MVKAFFICLSIISNYIGGIMKPLYFKFLIILSLMLTASPLLAIEEAVDWSKQDYRIGPGDVLDISVWKDEALTKLVTVLPDGKISFPLIGEITAGGKTVAQLSRELEQKLNRFVPDVNLSLLVAQVNSMLIYVIGRVNNPGRFILNAKVNVLQGLALAGGLNPFAKRSNIKIFRREEDQTRVFPFDYDDVTKGESLEQNILLKKGDVIVVP